MPDTDSFSDFALEFSKKLTGHFKANGVLNMAEPIAECPLVRLELRHVNVDGTIGDVV